MTEKSTNKFSHPVSLLVFVACNSESGMLISGVTEVTAVEVSKPRIASSASWLKLKHWIFETIRISKN